MRVTDALHRHARTRPYALAVADGDLRLSWADLARLVDEAVASLCQQGLIEGDRVALRAADGAAALIAALAVLHTGGVHAPIDHTLTPPEISAAETVLGVRWRLVLERTAPLAALTLEATGQAHGADPLAPRHSAFLRCSSGTTGLAKGILLSHSTIVARIAAANAGLGLTAEDRVLWLLPMAYHFAVSILLYLEVGAAIVFGNSLRASTTAARAREHAVTFLYGSPWHIRRLAELPTGQDLPASLRQVVSTTIALDADAAALFHRRHGRGVRQAFGIIEAGLPLLSAGEPGETVGRFVIQPAFQVAVLSPAGEAVSRGVAGELAITGPGLFDAYLSPWQPRQAGWFRTGDVARIEDDGSVQLLGRIKDVINVGGVKVFPLEVEAVLSAHPAVVACRVHGASDPRTGEQVVAEVAVSCAVDASALVAWCAERLAPLKRPAQIAIHSHLPMTPSGKVRRPQRPSSGDASPSSPA